MNNSLNQLMTLLIAFSTISINAAETKLSLAVQKKAEARQFIEKKEYLKAGQSFREAVQLGLSYEYGQWKAVDSYIKAKALGQALQIMSELAENGDTQIDYYKYLSEYFTGENNKQFIEIMAKVKLNTQDHNNEILSHKGVESHIYTQDVDHFFKAFDQAKNMNNIQEKKAAYEINYFDKASIGMVDYISMKVNSIDDFVDHIENNRAYYEDVRLATKKIKKLIPDALKAMGKMKDYYPQATSSNIYFIVGMHTSAGTASSNGILIGADFISSSKQNTENLNEWTLPFITAAEDKVWVIVHEYVHTLQNTNTENILGNALVEGGADFLANLLYATPKQPKKYTSFGLANECRIKYKFIKQIDTNDLNLWTGNNGEELPKNWVPDLGYFIGHQISQAYYQQAKDKTQAIKDLLELKSPKTILSKSGYMNLDNPVDCR